MNIGDGRCFFQKIRDLSLDSISIFIISNNTNKIFDNCVRGMKLKNKFDNNIKFNNLNKLNIKKNIIIYKNIINKNNNTRNIDNIININYYDQLVLEKSVDTIIIDFESKEIIDEFLNNNIKKINCNILIKKYNYLYDYKFKDWYINDYEKFLNMKYINPNLNNNNKKNYCESYIILKKVIDIFKKFNINYCLYGYDSLTCFLSNSHSVFSNTIEICCNITEYDKIISDKFKSEDIFSSIQIKKELNTNIIIIYFEKTIIKMNIYFYKINNDNIFLIDDNILISSEDFKPKNYNFGPITIKNFNNPSSYLEKKFGKKYKYELDIISSENPFKNPLIIYSDYYNYYSHWRSKWWNNDLIGAGIEFVKICKINNIKCWLDGGCLLGAVRNSDVPPGDDDIDIGIFNNDLKKLKKLKLVDKYGLYRKKINGIIYDVEILNYYLWNDKYKCDRYSDNKYIKNRADKCAIPIKYFNNLENIKLGDYMFPCPKNPYEYVELEQRYGKNCVNNDPDNSAKSFNTNYIEGWGIPKPRY